MGSPKFCLANMSEVFCTVFWAVVLEPNQIAPVFVHETSKELFQFALIHFVIVLQSPNIAISYEALAWNKGSTVQVTCAGIPDRAVLQAELRAVCPAWIVPFGKRATKATVAGRHQFAGAWCRSIPDAMSDAAQRVLWYFGLGAARNPDRAPKCERTLRVKHRRLLLRASREPRSAPQHRQLSPCRLSCLQ